MGSFGSSPEDETSKKIAILEEKNICRTCIGRYLSLDRARLLKYCPMDRHFSDCAACHGIISSLDRIRKIAKDSLGQFPYHDIQVVLLPSMMKFDEEICNQLSSSVSCSIKNYLKSELAVSLNHTMSAPTLIMNIRDVDSVKCTLKWPDVYIFGHYFKESRRVSHTRFFAGNPISSVESELIRELSKPIKCADAKFQSAGREDADVRMIGSGRPFLITLQSPLPNPNLPPPTTIEEFFSGLSVLIPNTVECQCGVSAKDIKLLTKEPNMDPKHVKCYRCIVSCSRNVSDEMLQLLKPVQNLKIHQRTPVRVAHRREMMDREKTVVSLDYKQICPRFFVLDLRTSSGTYIKEFVNSDFGRTNPSLGELLDQENPVACELLQLDVVYVGDE